jgi:hypothetical protein
MSTDLNRIISDIKKTGTDLEKRIKEFYEKYENFYKESYSQFNVERMASGSMNGLEDFYRLIQTVKRNRDVVSSLIRGMTNLRPIEDFKWIEEDIIEEKKKLGRPPKKKVATQAPVVAEAPLEGLVVSELISAVESAKEE